MHQDLTALDAHLETRAVDGYLIHADSADPDQYYLTDFDAPDPFLALYDGDVRLLFTRSLEYPRARREAAATSVERGTDYDYGRLVDEYGRREGWTRTAAAFLAEYGVSSVATPPRFPLGFADGLREQDIVVRPDDEPILAHIRARKRPEELEAIRTTQRATEAAMTRVEELLAKATVDADRLLVLDGDVLTSERVKTEIDRVLLDHRCAGEGTIVACGADAADPHDRGSGSLLADESIIVDIFPRHKNNRYFADMTRTFCRGSPDPTLEAWYEHTRAAKRAALETVEAGVTGEAVHDAACDVYEDAGIPTLRSDETTETGFIHSTGHGVGLAIHEQPGVGPDAGELEAGNVITIEPGVYDPDVGGVRLEDLVVVTETGFENLTTYEQSLVVQPNEACSCSRADKRTENTRSF